MGRILTLVGGAVAVGFWGWVGAIALLSGSPVRAADPVPVPATKPVVPTQKPAVPSKPDNAAQKILGQWLTKEPLAGEMVMFVFAPDGKAFLISGQSRDGKPLIRPIQYQINAQPKPMHLDVILTQDAIVQTLFEFTKAGDLRIQMLETYPGKPRPATLTPDATLFQKISDSTTPPPGETLSPR